MPCQIDTLSPGGAVGIKDRAWDFGLLASWSDCLWSQKILDGSIEGRPSEVFEVADKWSAS